MKRNLGVLLLAVGVLLCSVPATSFACSDCDVTSHCVSQQDGLGDWCVSLCNPVCSCNWGGSCIGGGGGGDDQLPPKRHAVLKNEEDRQAQVRAIIASSADLHVKLDQLVEVAKWQEIQGWCDGTPGCVSHSYIDGATDAKRYTWGRLKLRYQ